MGFKSILRNGLVAARRFVVPAFVVFHLASCLLWQVPGLDGYQLLVPLVRVYMDITGCHQNWGMFAPNPYRMSAFVFVTFDDKSGREWRWSCPHPALMTNQSPVLRERWRKCEEAAAAGNLSQIYGITRWAWRHCRAAAPVYPVHVRLWNVQREVIYGGGLSPARQREVWHYDIGHS